MNLRVNRLIDEALQLAPDERLAIVVALLDSLDRVDNPSVARAWAGEIRQRKADLQSGAATTASWSKAKARLGAL